MQNVTRGKRHTFVSFQRWLLWELSGHPGKNTTKERKKEKKIREKRMVARPCGEINVFLCGQEIEGGVKE